MCAFGASRAQCPTADGDQVSYGAGSWIGYVYDGVDNFDAANYQGTITEPENFDESFCGANCDFTAASGCLVNSNTFTVRFKMQKTFDCGTHQFIIGGDDGVRLSIDGGLTYLINFYTNHAYATRSASVFLTAGTYDLVLDYYENDGQNRVSFSSSLLFPARSGQIAGSQNLCQPVLDPAPFTNILAPFFCSGLTPTYQWQDSPNGTVWSNISGATSQTYDPPAGFPVGTRYFRRTASDGTTTVTSNVLTVAGDSPQGDQITYGTDSWIGYVYDGAQNYLSVNYLGYFTEPAMFDEPFCGGNCTFALTGCDVVTETFSVRFKMRITLPIAGYTFTIGGDDGVRLSIDGGNTFILNDYSNHPYRTVTSSVIDLEGTYDFVLEYYEQSGGNRVSFSYVAGPLPVTWAYLNGFHQDDKNVIEWHTSSELNNHGFEVQRSITGIEFDSIGFVVGSGTSQLPQTYVFEDLFPSSGWNYYRLKQIDYDGASEYSQLIPIRVSEVSVVAVYPNPATQELFVSRFDNNEQVTVTLRHIISKRPYELHQDPKQPSRFSLENVDPGIYIANITVGQKAFVEKLIIH